MNRTTIMLGLAGLFMGGLFAIAGFGSKVSFGRTGDGPSGWQSRAMAPTSTSSSQTPMQLTASDLWGAYNHDPVAADHRYKEKTFLITGVVFSVARDFHSNVILQLATGQVFETVRATLATRDANAIATVVKGQTVSATCVGRGALIGAPILDSCILR